VASSFVTSAQGSTLPLADAGEVLDGVLVLPPLEDGVADLLYPHAVNMTAIEISLAIFCKLKD